MRRQIIEYLKKLGLSSKIIVDEDFDRLHLPLPVLSDSTTQYPISTAIFVIVISKISNQVARSHRASLPVVIAATTLPSSYSIFNIFKKIFCEWRMQKQADAYIAAILKYTTLNQVLVGYLSKGIQIDPDLNNARVALDAANIIFNSCYELHRQLLLQKHYTVMIPYETVWNFQVCPKNATLIETTNYIIDMIKEFSILASHSYIGLLYALNETSTQANSDDFEFIFEENMKLTLLFNANINSIEEQMNLIESTNNITKDIP